MNEISNTQNNQEVAKVYSTPQLTLLGPIHSLVQSGLLGSGDGGAHDGNGS